jgi:hypothetical protein
MPISRSPEIKHGTISAYNNHKCRCDECKAKKAEYARRTRERYPDYAKNYYAANTELCRQRTEDWRQRNLEASRKKSRDWSRNNPERRNAKQRRWNANNKDKLFIANKKLQAERRKAKSYQFTAKDWRRLVRRFGSCCAYCGVKAKMTVEHVVPIVRGGTHSIGNILPVCKSCNSSKNKKLLIEWRRYRGDI